MSKNSYDDYIVLDEGLVDISSGKAAPTQSSKGQHSTKSGKNPNKKNNNNKKKIIIISSVAAAVCALGGGLLPVSERLFSSR